jgi:hypothetical protein
VRILDDYFTGCKVFQDCNGDGIENSEKLDAEIPEPSCTLNEGTCVLYSENFRLSVCQTVMSVTEQGSALCYDAGTHKPPSITHTASSQYETATILTTLLDVAAASHSKYSLTREEMELALGGSDLIGTIGAGDPIADVRSSVGGDAQAKAQNQLAWNAQFISIITASLRLIEAQSNESPVVMTSPSEGQPHTQAALSALKSAIMFVKGTNRRRLVSDRSLLSTLDLGAADVTMDIVTGAFAELSNGLAAASNPLTVFVPSLAILNSVVSKVSQANKAIADAASSGLLTIGQLNVYNHMQQTVAEETKRLATGDIDIATFENNTDTSKLMNEARLAIETISFDRFGPPTNSPTSMPTKLPISEGKKRSAPSDAWLSSRSFWLAFALALGFAALGLLAYWHFMRITYAKANQKRKSKIAFEKGHREAGLGHTTEHAGNLHAAKGHDLERILVHLDDMGGESKEEDIVDADPSERYPNPTKDGQQTLNVLENSVLAATLAQVDGVDSREFNTLHHRASPIESNGVSASLSELSDHVHSVHPSIAGGITVDTSVDPFDTTNYKKEAKSPPAKSGDLHRILLRLDGTNTIGFMEEGKMPTEEEERDVLAHRTIEAAEDMPEHGELREFTVQLARDPVTNSLGMQFKHNHIFDKVCISVVKPRGPADVSGQINVGDHLIQLNDWVLPTDVRLDQVLSFLQKTKGPIDFRFSTADLSTPPSSPLVLTSDI